MGAFVTELVARINKKWVFPLALISILVSSSFAFLLASQVYSGGVVSRAIESDNPAKLTVSLPSGSLLPIRIILEADGMSVLMAIIVAIMSLVVIIYSRKFIRKKLTLFYPLFLIMVSGTYGMMLTGDLFNLFVFIEIVSISGAGLITALDRKRAPDSAFKFLVMSTIGALIILTGIGLLYGQYDSLNIAFLAKSIHWTFLDKVAFALMLAGLAMKAGSVPMHMWVPDAYGDSPAPVSAFFVVGSQASLYALFRICFSLFGLSLNYVTAGWILIILGVLSMFVGVTMALPQKDIKRLMAFHAVSQTGYMLLGVGVGLTVLGTPAFAAFGFKAMEGGIFHVINHALYKGLLFLTAGAIFYATGTRKLNDIRGLAHYMPWTTVFFMVGAFSIAGLPPFNGFASKILIYESVYAFNPVLSAIAMLVSILTLASFIKVFYSAFLGPKPSKKPKRIPHSMLLAMLLLTLLILFFGLFPELIINNLIKPAVMALVNVSAYVGVFSGV
ncbi:MAG: NADH:ubiquinone oxidoreductase [Candidatus Diapherotrites archaeon]|nr:NADH:ubiquinone oxidoreductase [Candidatus Diapherotrites archaeon]